MFLPVFASVFILVIAIALANRRSSHNMQSRMNEFWAKERAANEVRRQPLDDLVYISIPEEFFLFPPIEGSGKATEALRILNNLREEKIVNLTGISNTDLKMRYGVANLPDLMHWDQNYTSLVRALQNYAEALSENKRLEEACSVLEYAIQSGTDVSASYRLLASLYVERQQSERIAEVLDKARALESLTSAALVKDLETLLSENS